MPRRSSVWIAPLLALAAACADRTPTAVPAPEAVPQGAVLIECRADVHALAMSCGEAAPALPGGVPAAVLGGQGMNVRLRNTNVVREGGEFRTEVTVENLVAQALGTADGVTPSAEGVRVYFHAPPRATRGDGEVTVANADGQAYFTEALQDFFRYDGILAPGDTSAAKPWRFALPAAVEAFSFQVYVTGAVAHEVGWIGVSPPVPSVGVGDTMQLSATVHGVSGRPLPGHIVQWSSSDPSIATVAADGTLAGVKVGTVVVTATSNARTGSAVVQVGSASGDGIAPTVRALSFSPARVDADGADSVTAEVRVTDAGAGVGTVAVSFVGPAAGQDTTCVAFAPASGSRADGVFRCGIGIRRRSEGGVWKVRYVQANDQAGNYRIATTPQLDAAGVETSLYVRSADPDVTAPATASMAFSPDSVVAGGDSVSVRMRVTDAGGVGSKDVQARFTSPSAAQEASCLASSPSTGTVFDGVYACRIGLPAGAEAGDWSLLMVTTWDSVGNVRNVRTAELEAAGFPVRLHVANPGSDVTPPSLTGFSFAPGTVAANGVDSVTMTMQLADTGAGVREAAVAWTSPSHSIQAACFTLAPASGTRTTGTFQCRMAIPAGAETGAWEVLYLEALDQAGNRVSFTPAQLQAAGYSVTLTVTGG